MRILIVAPEQAGVSAGEIVAAASGNRPRILTGAVTMDHLDAVLQREQFEIIHLAQHGDHQVLQMSDGLMHEEQLLRVLGCQTGVRLVFINACHSAGIAARLHNALGCTTVAHAAPINDALAVAYAKEFYRSLAVRFDPHQADDAAYAVLMVEAQRLGVVDYARPILTNGDMVTLQHLNRAVQRLEREQQETQRLVSELVQWIRVVVPLSLLAVALLVGLAYVAPM